MDSMSAVSSVLAVGVLQGQPVNSVPRVPLDCIAKSGCLCSVPFYYPVHLQWTVSHRVLFSLLLPHMDAVMKGLSGAILDQPSGGKGQDCW